MLISKNPLEDNAENTYVQGVSQCMIQKYMFISQASDLKHVA